MSRREETGGDDGDRHGSTPDGPQGIRLEIGLRKLYDVIHSLVGVDIARTPPTDGTGERTDRTEARSDAESRFDSPNGPRNATADRYLIDTRFEGDEFVVHADIPGAGTDEITVGLDPRTDQLVIAETGFLVESVDLPWSSPEATNVRFNNGVLEVRLRSAAA